MRRVLAVALFCAGLFCLAQQPSAQDMLLHAGSPLSVPAGSLLLDTLSASPSLAYSSRKLRSAYPGKALQTQSSVDVGFNGSNDLDTSGLSGTNAIKIWYNQSVAGGSDASQTNAGRQPVIQSSGTLQTQNNHVWQQAISANTTNLDITATLTQPYTIAALFKFSNTAIGNTLVGDFSNSKIFINIANISGAKLALNAGSSLAFGAPDTNLHSLFAVVNGGSSSITIDGTTVSGAAGVNNVTAFQIWEFAGDGNLGEFIILPGALTPGSGDLALIRSSFQSYWLAP